MWCTFKDVGRLCISVQKIGIHLIHIYRLAQDLYMAGIHVCTLAIVEINVSVSGVCPQWDFRIVL